MVVVRDSPLVVEAGGGVALVVLALPQNKEHSDMLVGLMVVLA